MENNGNQICLSKEQTLSIIHSANKHMFHKNRYAFYTKFPWKCLGCLRDIFISFEQYGNNSVFCADCRTHAIRNPNIVQFQYVRRMKEEQMKLVKEITRIIKID